MVSVQQVIDSVYCYLLEIVLAGSAGAVAATVLAVAVARVAFETGQLVAVVGDLVAVGDLVGVGDLAAAVENTPGVAAVGS